ncbi:MAG: cupin domain-containing protein [Puniceicoccaceae bacterium]
MNILLKPLLFVNLCLLTGFLHAHTSSTSAEVEVLQKASLSWDGSPLPAYPKGTPEVTILRITIPPHSALPMHHHPVINAGLLLEGALTVHTPDGRTLQLKAGDTLIELVNQPHYGHNPGDEPAVIVVFYAGVQGTPITVLENIPSTEKQAPSKS